MITSLLALHLWTSTNNIGVVKRQEKQEKRGEMGESWERWGKARVNGVLQQHKWDEGAQIHIHSTT